MNGTKGEKCMNEVDLYQTFVEAEKFYYDKFWLGIIGVALTLFFLWVMVLYANKKQKIISLIIAINVNLKMYKSGNLKMYNFTH